MICIILPEAYSSLLPLYFQNNFISKQNNNYIIIIIIWSWKL